MVLPLVNLRIRGWGAPWREKPSGVLRRVALYVPAGCLCLCSDAKLRGTLYRCWGGNLVKMAVPFVGPRSVQEVGRAKVHPHRVLYQVSGRVVYAPLFRL